MIESSPNSCRFSRLLHHHLAQFESPYTYVYRWEWSFRGFHIASSCDEGRIIRSPKYVLCQCLFNMHYKKIYNPLKLVRLFMSGPIWHKLLEGNNYFIEFIVDVAQKAMGVCNLSQFKHLWSSFIVTLQQICCHDTAQSLISLIMVEIHVSIFSNLYAN